MRVTWPNPDNDQFPPPAFIGRHLVGEAVAVDVILTWHHSLAGPPAAGDNAFDDRIVVDVLLDEALHVRLGCIPQFRRHDAGSCPREPDTGVSPVLFRPPPSASRLDPRKLVREDSG